MKRVALAVGVGLAAIAAMLLWPSRDEPSATAEPAVPAAAIAAPAPQPTLTRPAVPAAAPARKSTRIAKLQASRAEAPSPSLPPAPAAAFEAARDVERAAWPRGDDRSPLMAMLGEEGFESLFASLQTQMKYDEGARELAQLFADGARGKLPADGSTRLLRLACGLRLCVAHFESSGSSSDLPRLGYNSISTGTPQPNGGMVHRLVFSLDTELHVAPQAQPPARP